MTQFTSAFDQYFVAIGASAGGLEAIHEFFDNMPVSEHLSFVIIQHLSPEHKSLLTELLAKHTAMSIVEARHDMQVDKGCIYVIPNNKLLTIKEGRLQLGERGQMKAPNTAINTFFNSLAEDQGQKAIGVILSGTGTDGTAGAKEIKKRGGIIFVQDPTTAKFDGMPNSAISGGVADYILSPELIPDEIFSAINEKPKRKHTKDGLDESKLFKVLERIHEHCGYDFTNYKTPTLLRRISRRMDQVGQNNFDDYLDFLNQHDEECELLGKDFLIGVTKFFRDQPVFDILENNVLPNILSNRDPNDPIKVWATACSTGQEAYSLAISIDRYLANTGKKTEVKIFACDLDKEAVDVASKGAYPISALNEMDVETRNRYFSIEGDVATIIPRIRKQIVFSVHNILRDPPFIKNDLVTCRNMLIYMNPILQEKVFGRLQFALKTKGYLVLGPSEVPHSIKSSLDEVDGRWKVYRKVAQTVGYDPNRLGNYQVKQPGAAKLVTPLKESTVIRSLTDDFRDLLAEEQGYAGVYLDKSYEIKAAIGNYRHYLALPDNLVNFNILKMMKTDLSVALNTAIRQANADGRRVAIKNIRTQLNGQEAYINILVKAATANTYTAVIFSEATEGRVTVAPTDRTTALDEVDSGYALALEEELRETRRNLQTAIESLESANEELQSGNEELLSANEELQSSNEELQSLNEELHTLNTEHQLRIRELIELNDDLNNHFASTEVGQIFLDDDLRIRKFSPSAASVVKLRDTDTGRPLEHIATNLLSDTFLIDDLKDVLRHGNAVEKEVETKDGRVLILRILPYVRKDKETHGLVITFVDVTANKELHSTIRGVFDSSISAIITAKAIRNEKDDITDFACIAGNEAAGRFSGVDNESYVGKTVSEILPQFHQSGFFNRCVEAVNSRLPIRFETTFDHNGKPNWYDVVLIKLGDGVIINLTDINEKKEADERFKTAYHELVKTKNSVNRLNAELEEKVRSRTAQLTESEERFRIVAAISSDAIWDWNLAGNTIWWSESFFSLFGYKPAEVADGSRFWFNHIHPDDLAAVRDSMDGIMNGEANEWVAHYRFQKADGSYAHILNKSSVLHDEQNIPYRIISSMVDVTAITEATHQLEKKNTELQSLIEEFKFVTDFMPQIVWSAMPDGYHDFYNKGWYDYTGLSYEQTKGEGWNKVVHPDDKEQAWNIWWQSLETGEPYEIEYRFRRHDGSFRWFLGRALPLRDEDGTILKWFGTCTDIHDQKTETDLLEEKVAERTAQLLASNLTLEERNNELLQFTSITSHDLKEPLRKIRMFGVMVKDKYFGTMPTEAQSLLVKIVNASERMAKLIDGLLNYSQVDADSLYKETDLNQLVAQAMDDLELAIKEKNAVIETSPLTTVECVPEQFQRVFQNLISNSLKFARKEERPLITITGEFVTNNLHNGQGEAYRIFYKDNGIGFEKHFAKKIFEIFQRLHPTDRYEGTGIGLAIVKKIVERHHGEIIADGEHNRGATFVITIPVHQAKKARPIDAKALTEKQ